MREEVTEENIPEMIRLYKDEHVTLQQLSKRYKKNRQQLKEILVEHGVKIRGKGLGRKPIENRYPLNEWCKLYKEGKTIREIYDIYNHQYCQTTIRRYIKESIGLRKPQIKEWIRLYEEGKTLQEIEDLYGVTKTTISSHLRKNGIRLRTMNDYFNPNLKEDYFSVIDTEAKAYFLGLLITDGSITKSNNRQAVIRLQLQETDKYILEEFRKELGLSANLSQDKRDGSWRIAIPSDKIAQDLAKYSCTERKSTTTRLPILENEMMPHLIRGIIDGNGTIYIGKGKKRTFYIGLCGASPIVNDVREYLIKNIGLSEVKLITRIDPRSDRTIPLYVVQWGGRKDFLRLGSWLYDDAHVYLKRKYQKYLNMKTPC